MSFRLPRPDWTTRAIACGLAAAALTVLAVVHAIQVGAPLYDFRGDLYQAGAAILHGRDPYRPQYLAHLAASMRLSQSLPPWFAVPVYPAPTLIAATPLALLPYVPAGIIYVGLMVAATLTGLRLLGVRDWRCIALALASWPSVDGLEVGNLGPFLLLGIGVTWRFRDRLWPPALAVGTVVVAKLFPWTLLAWLLVTRRLRTLAITLISATVVIVGAWALLGFAGFTEYPRMLSNLALIERRAGTSLDTLLIMLGVSSAIAEAAGLMVALLLLALAYRYGRRQEGEAAALGLAVIAALIATPLAWPHYYLLLFAPIALVSPRLSAVWFVPALTSLVPVPGTATGQLLWLCLVAVVAAEVCRSIPRTSTDAPARTTGRLHLPQPWLESVR